MNTIPRVVVDPYLLCLKGVCDSKDAFEAYAERLISWVDLIDSRKVIVLVSERCIGTLIQSEEYPFTHSIRDTIKKYNITHISSDFLERVTQWILELRPCFEDAINTEEVVALDCNTLVKPGIYLSRLSVNHRKSFQDSLVAAAHWLSNDDREFDILVGSVPTTIADFETIEVSTAADGFFKRCGALIEYSPPKFVKVELECVFDCGQLISARDSLEVWNQAGTVEDVCRAFHFRVEEHQKCGLAPKTKVYCRQLTSDEDWVELQKKPNTRERVLWMVGPKFLESINTWNFNTVGKQASLLIDACSRILLHAPKQELNEFKEGKNSKQQEIRGDGALGFRTHLSKDGVAYRLLFWRHKDGIIEFANVANKAECKIY